MLVALASKASLIKVIGGEAATEELAHSIERVGFLVALTDKCDGKVGTVSYLGIPKYWQTQVSCSGQSAKSYRDIELTQLHL